MIIPAVDVGLQRGYPDAQLCWGDSCYNRPNPGVGMEPLGLCERCDREIRRTRDRTAS